MNYISIVTRTKDRPLTLKRTLKSILGQSISGLQWIIVNDGGPNEPVNEIADQAKCANIGVHVIHNHESVGMEVASNVGLKEATGKYVIIHDDDDSWEADFLRRTVDFMEDKGKEATIRGVVTRTMVVEEVIDVARQQITTVRKHPFDESLQAISIFRIARLARNFPPISFLYEREVLDQIGYYRGDAPFIGDWEFNLRFLKCFDIGVIPEYLANYHVRRRDKSTNYSNSVIGALPQHAQYHTKILNEFLRRDLAQNEIGIGFIMNICYELQDIRERSAFNWFVSPWYNKARSLLNRLREWKTAWR